MSGIINFADLPFGNTFEGYRHGDVNVSFFISNTPPGKGPRLHSHPYEEVFIIQEGLLTFTVGDELVEVVSGQIVIAPAGTQHKFVNTGSKNARHINIHVTSRMETTWLEAQTE